MFFSSIDIVPLDYTCNEPLTEATGTATSKAQDDNGRDQKVDRDRPRRRHDELRATQVLFLS